MRLMIKNNNAKTYNIFAKFPILGYVVKILECHKRQKLSFFIIDFMSSKCALVNVFTTILNALERSNCQQYNNKKKAR